MTTRTRIITTPSGESVHIKEYLTAREMNDYKRLFLSYVNMDISEIDTTDSSNATKKVNMDKLPGTVLIDIEEKQIKLCVVSVGDLAGSEEVFNMREEDYNFVLQEIKKLFDTQKKMNG